MSRAVVVCKAINKLALATAEYVEQQRGDDDDFDPPYEPVQQWRGSLDIIRTGITEHN